MFLSVLVDYFATELILKDRYNNKLIIISSVIINISILITFKYFGTTLGLIFPAGLSFLTFQSMSYSLDAYYKKHDGAKSFSHYFAFVFFFPQLIAGPICRAKDILPQLDSDSLKLTFSNKSVAQIVHGLFFKLVLADTLHIIVSPVFNSANLKSYSALDLWLGMIAYSFEIYFDFHGYSLIAIGICGLIGLKIPDNFNLPYHAVSLRDFWRRWHISLSSWFRDYLYIPLSSAGRIYSLRNFLVILLVFSLSGAWHGNSLLFLIWGMIHGLVYILEWVFDYDKLEIKSVGIKLIFQIKTFLIVTLAWVPFRSESIDFMLKFYDKLLTLGFNYFNTIIPTKNIYFIVCLFIGYYLLSLVRDKARYNENIVYLCFLLVFTIYFRYGSFEFIYYRF